MEFTWKFLVILTIGLTLIEQIHCLNEIDILDSSISTSDEDIIIIKNINVLKRDKSDSDKSIGSSEENLLMTTTEKTEESSSEPTKTAMDIITIVWYTSTFLALAAFFFLMACSDRRRCGRRNDLQNSQLQNRNDSLQCPPSPAPSYREFAPPSYDTVIKQGIYVIPINDVKLSKDNYDINNCNESLTTQPNQIIGETKVSIVNEITNLQQTKNG